MIPQMHGDNDFMRSTVGPRGALLLNTTSRQSEPADSPSATATFASTAYQKSKQVEHSTIDFNNHPFIIRQMEALSRTYFISYHQPLLFLTGPSYGSMTN